MKSKNLVSLSVAAVFLVLSVTGLMIYAGQGGHVIDHTHAWFGILFVAAAVFHIVNNWPSLKAYSVSRSTSRIQRELVLPSVVVLVFVVGIATDMPVFKELANAGKKAFGGKKPPRQDLSKMSVDSIARRAVADHALVNAQTIHFDTTAALADNIIMAQGTATHAGPDSAAFRFTEVLTLTDNRWTVAAEQLAPLRP